MPGGNRRTLSMRESTGGCRSGFGGLQRGGQRVLKTRGWVERMGRGGGNTVITCTVLYKTGTIQSRYKSNTTPVLPVDGPLTASSIPTIVSGIFYRARESRTVDAQIFLRVKIAV